MTLTDVGSEPPAPGRSPRSPRPTLVDEVLSWLRDVLGRPSTSYHLVLGSVALLLVLGLLMVLSASGVNAYLHFGDSYYYFKRQVVFCVVGLIAAVVLMKVPAAALRILSWFAVGLAAILLILTYTPLGIVRGGNRSWLFLGSSAFSIQPAEFAKLAMIVWAADVMARKERLLDQPKHLLVPLLPVAGLLVLLVVFQHDAGTAVVMAAIVAGMLWIVGAPLRVFGVVLGAGALGVAALFVSSPNRMRRLGAYLNPNADPYGANDQANASMFAVATGAWWGLGLGASRQKWGTLPEAHTDFIFAVIGEEFGLFGSLVVLGLFGVLGYAGVRIATRSDDPFARYVAGGITTWFMVQALVNLGVVLRLLPVAGVPLPLVSYGGSSLIANLMGVGVLLACARREPAARRALNAEGAGRKPRMTVVVSGRTPRKRR